MIALFAASAAVHDMANTSHFDKERKAHLEERGLRYGYGSFNGGDGWIHIGIEKAPFVEPRTIARQTKQTVSFRNRGAI
ncbi:hypothetical protein BS50DRAFT_567265 [Corynespora cassiicola Philippines]|uniref:Uncharacterized protein n=1 Tax=Corynespora cassiicola Philippines TaxID=1448308 RepID=A0A2T2P9T6_CORCC|nr:hypothetical protein BS50DRAFT_567265 [Corynespora cassiicola Philippines]